MGSTSGFLQGKGPEFSMCPIPNWNNGYMREKSVKILNNIWEL